MSNLIPFSSKDNIWLQRRLTRDIAKTWFPTAIYGEGKIPVTKMTEATGKTVDPVAWATQDTAQSQFNLLGQLTPTTLDLDLDVRLTDAPHTRPKAWTDADKALAEEWFYRPFREEIKALTGDTRNHWGRASIGGTGHWLIRLLHDDELSARRAQGPTEAASVHGQYRALHGQARGAFSDEGRRQALRCLARLKV